MFLVLLLVLTHYVNWTRQHLTYPINYCNMASTCIHDHRMVCASTPEGCNRKSFLDQCDMYEYNCDYGTSYQETYILYCIGSDLEVQMPDQQTSTVTETMSMIDDNDLKDTNTEPLVITTPTTPQVPSINTEVIVADTTNQTMMTTTPMITAEPQNITNVSPVIIESTMRFPLSIQTTKKPIESTKNTDGIFTYCCDKPKTWETTKEVTKVFLSLTEKSNEIVKVNDDSVITTNKPKTTNQITTNQSAITDLPTITFQKATYSSKSPTTHFPTTFEATTKLPMYASIINCYRPKTWLTTVSKDLMLETVTKKIDIHTLKLKTPLSTKTTVRKINSTPITTTSSSTNSKFTFSKVPSTVAGKVTNTIATSESTTEIKSQENIIHIGDTDSGSHMHFKYEHTSRNSNTWWYPTICKSGRCQRPFTWFTTKSRRRKS